MHELETLDLKTLELLRDQEVLHQLICNLFYKKLFDETLLSQSEEKEVYEGLWIEQNINNNDEYDIWLEANKFNKKELEKKLEKSYKINNGNFSN